MDWADELAASVQGPQVVNDSKTPSGTVHVGSLRGPVILDVITRALRAPRPRDDAPLRRRRHGPDGRPGAPVARRHRARDGPPARPHPRPGRRRPRVATPATHAQTFIDLFSGLGIHPDRYYWMSDIYPTGQMDPFIRTALDRAASRARRSTAGSRTSSTPTTGCRSASSARTAARSGTTIAVGLGRRDGRRRVPPRPRRLGGRLRLDRAGSRRSAARRSCPGTSSGRRSGACSASRSSPTARTSRPPAGRATGRTRSPARSSSASRRSTSRTSSSTSPARKMSTSKGLGAAAHTFTEIVPPEQTRFLFVRPAAGERDRVRPRGHRRGPAPVRRVRPAGRRDRRPRGQGRAARRASTRSSATRCSTRRPTSSRPRGAFRPAFAHLALLVQVPGVDVHGAGRGREGVRR